MDEINNEDSGTHPKDEANIISKIFRLYVVFSLLYRFDYLFKVHLRMPSFYENNVFQKKYKNSN